MPTGSPSPSTPGVDLEHVLVVDDSPAIRKTVADALANLGVPEDRMTVLESGDDALATFTPLSPDLVLMDTSMPSLDPYDAVQAMLLEDPETRIVPLTERSTDDPIIGELLSFGVFEVLRKPVRVGDLEELFRSIEEEAPGVDRIP